jgi:hypothetical protein
MATKVQDMKNRKTTANMKTETAKMKSVSELVGIGGWSPISTWITTSTIFLFIMNHEHVHSAYFPTRGQIGPDSSVGLGTHERYFKMESTVLI